MRSTWRTVVLTTVAVLLLAAWSQAADAPKAAEKAKTEKQPVTAKPEELEKVTAAVPTQAPAKPSKPRKLLVFSLARGFVHSSIDIGARAFEIMGQKTGAWSTVISKDPAVFAPESLNQFDAVIMNNTTGGNLLTEETHKTSLLEFVKGGKGIGGVHSATDAFYTKWPEYGEMMGGYFAGHPFHKISVKLDDPASPINAVFGGKGFEFSDEIYTFKDPYSRDKLHILLSIDWENAHITKQGTRQDNDYALSWIREFGKGRVFYCAFGHEHRVFWNPTILQHYLAGIQYILGDLKADATPSARLKIEPARGPTLALAPQMPKAARSVAVYAAPAEKDDPKKPAPEKKEPAPLPPAAPVEPSGLKPNAEGWIILFDGKDLGAFQKPAADKWKVGDGVLAWENGCGNLWTKDKFGDFVLDLEVKCAKGTTSGLFLRSAEGDRDRIQNGFFKIQVTDSGGDRKPGKFSLGAVHGCCAPTVAAEKPVGEWNHLALSFKGNCLKIVLNDKTILDINLDDWKEAGLNPDGSKNSSKTAYKDRAKVGFLGLQDHGLPVWYRNVKVKPLDAK